MMQQEIEGKEANDTRGGVEKTGEGDRMKAIEKLEEKRVETAIEQGKAGRVLDEGVDVERKTVEPEMKGSEVLKDIGDKVGHAAQISQETVQKVWNATKEDLGKIAEVSQEKAGKVWEATKENLEKVAVSSQEKVEQMLESAKENISKAAEISKEKAGKGWESTKENLGKAAELSQEKASELFVAAKDNLGKAAELSQEKATEAWSATKEKTSDLAGTTMEKVTDIIETTKEKASEALHYIEEKAEKVVGTTKEKAGDALHYVEEKASNVTETTLETAAAAIELTKEKAGQVAQATVDVVKSALGTIGLVREKGEEVPITKEEMTEETEDSVNALPSNIHDTTPLQAAKTKIGEVIDTLKDKTSEVLHYTQEKAIEIIGQVEDKLEIKREDVAPKEVIEQGTDIQNEEIITPETSEIETTRVTSEAEIKLPIPGDAHVVRVDKQLHVEPDKGGEEWTTVGRDGKPHTH